MGVYALHASMMRGEITPQMFGRVDSELYQTGMKTAENVVATRYGGVTRSPGTLAMGALKEADGPTYLYPFVFNTEQKYALEFGDLYVRFWTLDGQVMGGGVPYEIVSPYAIANLPGLQLWQSGDVVYIVGGGTRAKRLVRRAETDWVFEDYEPQDGPYLEINTSGTLLTPAERGSAVPLMTSNTAPEGTVAGSGTLGANAFRWYDGNSESLQIQTGQRHGWTSYTFPAGVTKTVDGYWLQATSRYPQRMPVSWKFEGYDGADWVTLDTRSGETGFSAGEYRYYYVWNETAYEAYRLSWEGIDDPDADFTTVAQIGLHQKAEEQTPFSLTASSTEGINDGAGFVATDVDRPVRLLGSDGFWRWAKIMSFVSATEVKIVLYDHALPDTESILLWRLGAWSDTTGWPKTLGSFENRLAFANTDSAPFDVWLTRSAAYEDYGVTDPLVEDDAVTARPNPTGTGLNPVNWILGATDLLMGTAGALKALGPRDPGVAFGPANVRQLASNAVGTSGRLPGLLIGGVVLFVGAYGRRLYEALYSSEADGYVSQDLSVLNEHLFRAGIIDYAFQDAPHKVLWCVLADGGVLAVTYDRDQKVFGATRRDLGGVADSVIVLPDPDAGADTVLFTVRRQVNGSTVATLEKLAPFYRADQHDYPVYLDGAVVHYGAPTATLAGLSHLEGETVGVWADGVDVGDAAVTGGEVTVPGGAASIIVAGLRYLSKGVTLPLVNWGQRDGGTPGRPIRVTGGFLSVFETGAISYGTEDEQVPWSPEIAPAGPTPLRTGVLTLGTLDDRWGNQGVIAFSSDSAYPFTVRSVSLLVEGA